MMQDFSQDDALRQQWLNHRSSTDNDGLTALHRSWAIETGIIEGIYWLDEAQTRTLIEQGFEPENIPRPAPAKTPTTCRTTCPPSSTSRPTMAANSSRWSTFTPRLHRRSTYKHCRNSPTPSGSNRISRASHPDHNVP